MKVTFLDANGASTSIQDKVKVTLKNFDGTEATVFGTVYGIQVGGGAASTVTVSLTDGNKV